jgi:hypothetical protein
LYKCLHLFRSPGPCRVLLSLFVPLSSFVCKLFTYQSFSHKPMDQMEPNLAEVILIWFLTYGPQHYKYILFHLDSIQNGCYGQLCCLIGWNFKDLLLRTHICEGNITYCRNIHYITLNKVIVLFVYLNSNMAAITGQSFFSIALYWKMNR